MMKMVLVLAVSGTVLSDTALAATPAAKPPVEKKTQAAAPQIDHTPLQCVLAKTNPRIQADITAQTQIRKNRVYFKAHQFPAWYYIDMKPAAGASYLALLPQPVGDTKQIDYYVEVLDAKLQSARTAEFAPEILSGGTCRQDIALPTGFDRDIILGGTKEGQTPIPPGFSKIGIKSFITAAGVEITGVGLSSGAATTSAGSATASTAGGVSATTIGLGAAGAAVVVGGVAVATSGENKADCSIEEFTKASGGMMFAIGQDACGIEIPPSCPGKPGIRVCIANVCGPTCGAYYLTTDGRKFVCEGQYNCGMTANVPNLASPSLGCVNAATQVVLYTSCY
ncbi:MAG: hypothetical protein MUF51_01810 [Vicinamibacteria bacterium]|jgi:hypothetical protein|nr:hypothetical protein [Vicinamibacteria bacterium]